MRCHLEGSFFSSQSIKLNWAVAGFCFTQKLINPGLVFAAKPPSVVKRLGQQLRFLLIAKYLNIKENDYKSDLMDLL